MDDPYNHEVQKKFRELAIRFERRLVLSRRLQGTAGDSTKRTMGGLLYYATQNAVSDVKANLRTATNLALQNIYNKGGNVSTIWVSANIKNVFDSLNDSPVRTTQDTSEFRRKIDSFASSFGSIDIRFSRYVPQKKAIFLSDGFVSKRDIDGYFHELLAKTGDSTVGEVVAEKSLEVREPNAHAVLTVTDA
jgi:hypothetical protein